MSASIASSRCCDFFIASSSFSFTRSIVFFLVGNGVGGGLLGWQATSGTAHSINNANFSAAFTATLIAEIVKLQRKIGDVFLDQRHRCLQVVFLVAGDAHARALD